MENKMITDSLFEFKTRQNELHRQAEHYRLVKSFQQNNSLASRFVKAAESVFTLLISLF
jgi:hypothetical protein